MNAKNWIRCPINTESKGITFVKEFSLRNQAGKATLRISSVGLFAAYLNGKRLGRGVLTPGYTQYHHRVQYMTYDITCLLTGQNRLEVMVGPGWAVGRLAYDGGRSVYSDHVALNLLCKGTDVSGATFGFVSDESFEVYTSPVIFSDIYDGEKQDYACEKTFLGHAVKDKNGMAFPLVRQIGPDIIEHERLAPVELIRTPKGETVLDFGQNLTGYVALNLAGKKGDRVSLSFAEVLDKDGNFYRDNYRSAKSEVSYVLDGEKREYKPFFSFQGFRYVRVDEYPGEIDLSAFRAVVVHSQMKRIGSFSCGNPKINQLYHNTIWGQKSNYLDIPTDCPQRDERLGWTGDAQVFCRTAALNFDVRRFFEKWLSELRLDQREDGAIWGTCPENFATEYHTRVSAAWGDAATIIPSELYMAYGNPSVLEDNFEMMRRWVEYMHGAGPEEYLWLGGYHYGDWLAMDAGGDSYVGATSNDLIASAFFARSTELLVRAGEALGRDMTGYKELYRKVRAAFRDYFMKDGMPREEFPFTEVCTDKRQYEKKVDVVRKGVTQTGLVLILHFGLCEASERPALEKKLVELIENAGGLMATGFVGTPYILHVLSAAGRDDVAYRLLLEERNPSWLFSVTHGATTMWEHWNGIKEDGSFWSRNMNSFNHYAYGSVCDWIYSRVAGISPAEPGYRRILLSPVPNRALGFVNCAYESVAGRIESNWYYKGNDVYFEFTVPEGATAEIRLPGGYRETVGAGSYHYTVKDL